MFGEESYWGTVGMLKPFLETRKFGQGAGKEGAQPTDSDTTPPCAIAVDRCNVGRLKP